MDNASSNGQRYASTMGLSTRRRGPSVIRTKKKKLLNGESNNSLTAPGSDLPFFYSHSEAALPLVSTRKRDLWAGPTPEVRDPRTAHQIGQI